MRALLVAMSVLWGAGCSSSSPKMVELRPLTVRVVDAATKAPLAGVPVSYVLRTMVMREAWVGIIPNLEPNIGPRPVYRQRAHTDAHGEATFWVGQIRLRGDERLDEELVLINLTVDMSQSSAQSWLETLTAGCRAVPATCGGPPDDLDVALAMSQDGKRRRLEAYRNPIASYAGVFPMVIPGTPNTGFRDWTEPDDRFAVKFHFTRRMGPEVAVVALAPSSGSASSQGPK